MTNSRELLLHVVSESPDDFLDLMAKYKSKEELTDVIVSLSRKHLEELWTGLQQMCTNELLGLGNEEASDEDMQKTDDVLLKTIAIAMETISQEDVIVPQPLMETAVLLHGVLPSFTNDKLQNEVALMCETWCKLELEGHEAVVPQTLIYLLKQSLKTNVLRQEIRRVWQMKHGIFQIDFNNESSQELQDLLLGCLRHPAYVKFEEGRKFLSFLFGLSPKFIEIIHQNIKSCLPHCAGTHYNWYGEIYFKAWRDSLGPLKDKIETYCIQDLMYHAVHTVRGSSKSLGSGLRKILGHFHKQKKLKGVDEMLLHLYDPILWRSLKVANGNVRANAAAILMDVFPLRDLDYTSEQQDNLMQKQFDIIGTLLTDPYPAVRTIAVHGVCNMCVVFWQLIPSHTIKSLISKLVQDLACDSASSDVRVAVFQGLTKLLDNQLCYPLMKAVLRQLSDYIHDTSEKVRGAFVDLLLKVKNVQVIKYWVVVPMEHLLARLEVDTPVVAKKIVELIFSSFMPLNRSSDVKISRCITLIKENPGAARKFYKYSCTHMSFSETVSFMNVLKSCIALCVKKDGEENGEDVSVVSTISEEESEADKENEEENELSISEDKDVIAGLLEAIAIMWQAISNKLNTHGNRKVKSSLELRFGRVIPGFFKVFEDVRICDALLLLAGHLPVKMVPALSRTCLSKLKAMTIDSTVDSYGALLEAMSEWGDVASVLELVHDWLKQGLSLDHTPVPAKSRKKKKKSIAFVDTPQPALALDLLQYLSQHPAYSGLILDNHEESLGEIKHLLYESMELIDKRLVSSAQLNTVLTDHVITKCFSAYCRLEIILHGNENRKCNVIAAFEDILSWSEVHILPVVSSSLLHGGTADESASNLASLAEDVMKMILSVTSNMLLLGIGSQEFTSRLVDYINSILAQACTSADLLPPVIKLLYQTSEFDFSQPREGSDNDTSDTRQDVVSGILGKVVQSLAINVQKNKDCSNKILSNVRQPFSSLLTTYYQHHSLDDTVSQDVMSTIMATIVAEVTHFVEQEDHVDNLCQKISDLPVLTSFILNIIIKTKTLVSFFLTELFQCVKSGVLDTVHGYIAVLHLIHAVHKAKPNAADVKECLTSLQLQLEEFYQELPEQDSPERYLYDNSKTLMRTCMQSAGLVS